MTKTNNLLLLMFSVTTLSVASTPKQNTQNTDSVTLNEIVVEASREQTKLRNISGSVALLTTNQIDGLGINSLTDVTSTVANLFMPDYGSKLTSPIYIRGIGSRINSPSVGLYVDHVPYFEKAAFNFDFFDVSRIEVLRGPQGTEYGRNTMGGIINIRTLSPMNYQGTNLNIQAASYGTYLMNISHYAKPSEKFAWSLALNYRHNDGFFTNVSLNEKVDMLDSYGLRNRLIWHVNECFSIENIMSYENSRQGGYPYAVYYPAKDSVANINYNQKSGYNRNLLSDAFLLKYKGSNFDLTATSAYQYLDDNQYLDQDLSIDSIYFAVQKQKQNMASQELILQTKKNSLFSWLMGAYGYVQQFNTEVNVDTYTKKTEIVKNYNHTISGLALFQQTTINDFPVKNLSVTVGVRVDSENDKLAYKYNLATQGVNKLMADTTYKSLKSLQILPKISLNYTFKNLNIYSIISRGYKTGGFNSTFERPEDLTFDPEYSWNYEIGAKAALFNNLLFTETSLFYIDWENQQIYQKTPSGQGSMLKNAGKSVSKGFELSANTANIGGFELMANYGFTFAKFSENVLSSTADYSGNFIPYVPRHTVSGQLRKTIDFQGYYFIDRLIFSVMYKGVGDIYWNDTNLAKQDYYGTFDGRISFIRKNIQLDLWGSNLTNTKYNSFYFESLGKSFVQTAKPMQVGVKLALKF